ncbi:MAG: exonuclease domain-containing protein [Planctomycetota bacterium]
MLKLPPFYYLDHLLEVLAVVEEVHGVGLREDDHRFTAAFRALPRKAQAVWARMASRKGFFFRTEQLRYEEIARAPHELVEPMDRLREAGFARPLEPSDCPAFLRSQTKAFLIERLGRLHPAPLFRASWTKARLIETASEFLSFEDLADADGQQPTWVQSQSRPMAFQAFLFFGHYAEDLRAIALKDLGLLRTREGGGVATARFPTPQAAEAAFFYEESLHASKHGAAAQIDALVASVESWPQPGSEAVHGRRQKLLDRLGRGREAAGAEEEALRLYRASGSPWAREREVRIRFAAGDREWARTRLESMVEDPASDGECAFAADFYARKYGGQRTSAATDLLRAGRTVVLDEIHRHEPESAAARHLEAGGARAFVAENRLWHTLFGLTFWDLLFGPEAQGFHGDFEHLPATLREGSLYRLHRARVESALSRLLYPSARSELIAEATAAAGPNGLFSPSWFDAHDLELLLDSDAAEGIVQLLRAMAMDYPAQRSGYPDLVAIESGRASFLEVKAEGDAVRREQLVRLRQMRGLGLDASILNVGWRFDPDRIYAVVDVETTGRRAPQHRVTEVAIVRVQGDQELSRWSSLVNPERPIPRGITDLTGISNAMVRDAPTFGEVADRIEEQLMGALFVAHNATFDHGFLSDEFARLGRSFRYPRLCTVVHMRRHFPGSPSYSLARLCREHGISLDQHHRALSDALAAARLVQMIHQSRLQEACD